MAGGECTLPVLLPLKLCLLLILLLIIWDVSLLLLVVLLFLVLRLICSSRSSPFSLLLCYFSFCSGFLLLLVLLSLWLLRVRCFILLLHLLHLHHRPTSSSLSSSSSSSSTSSTSLPSVCRPSTSGTECTKIAHRHSLAMFHRRLGYCCKALPQWESVSPV